MNDTLIKWNIHQYAVPQYAVVKSRYSLNAYHRRKASQYRQISVEIDLFCNPDILQNAYLDGHQFVSEKVKAAC
jgi:hypothetical protein